MTSTDSGARRERLAERSFFDEIMQIRDQQRQEREDALWLVEEDELPWELNRQGYMRWYMAPTMDDIVMKTYVLYVQRIPAMSRSGKQMTQGGQVAFVWRGGPGYTVIDGERHDWDAHHVIQIPRRTRGCVVQHFNDSDADIDIIFNQPNNVHSATVDRGSGFEQIEDCPEFAASARRADAKSEA